jgi:hypothetical protein
VAERHGTVKADDGKDIIISVTADKRVFLGGRLLSDPREITRLVEEKRRKHPEKTGLLISARPWAAEADSATS